MSDETPQNDAAAGAALVDAWLTSQRALEAADKARKGAVLELEAAERTLATWLLPTDAQPGEQFVFVCTGLLIVATAGQKIDPRVGAKIAIRKRADVHVG